MKQSTVDVSVIIVSWNSENWLKKCLSSIFAQTSDVTFEVIVVDNASSDQSVQIAMNSFTGVQVVENSDNKGWATAVNQGIEAASGRYLCLLNPDTEVVDRTIEQLTAFMDKYPLVGMAGPHLRNPDGSTQRSIRRRPRLKDQLLIILKLHVLFPNAKALRDYLWLDFNYDATQEVEQIMGACMFLRREVIEQVGILDENFFLWFDEVDYCRRVYDYSNFKIFYNAHIHLVHAGGDSFDKVKSLRKQRWYLKSLRYYFRKHGHWGAYFVILFFTTLSIFLGWAGGLFKKSKPGRELEKDAKEMFKKA